MLNYLIVAPAGCHDLNYTEKRGIFMKNTVFPIRTENEVKLPYFANGMASSYKQEHIIRSNGFPTHLWLQTQSGSGRLVLGEEEYLVAEGQGLFLLPDEPHEYYPDSDEWIVDWISVSGTEAIDFMTNKAGLDRSGVYFISEPEKTRAIIEQLVQTEQSEDPLRNLNISSLVYSFLIQWYQNVSATSTNTMSQKYARLIPVLEYIDNHYNEAITLKDLSDLLGVTPQHLCTLFRKIMNTRIFEYINRVRIKKSKEYLLENAELPIRDVAHANGFEDVSYFCYIFKRIEHATPGDFRKTFIRN